MMLGWDGLRGKIALCFFIFFSWLLSWLISDVFCICVCRCHQKFLLLKCAQCIIAQHEAPEGLNRFPLSLFQWKSLVSSCFSLWTFHGPAIWACAGVATPEKKAKPTKWDKLDQHASRFDQMVVAHELPSVRLRDDQVPETPQRSRGERDARQDQDADPGGTLMDRMWVQPGL